VQRVVTTALPTEFGPFHAVGYLSHTDGAEHMALVAGRLDAIDGDVPVHIHTQCLSGDVLRSTLCDCRRSLDDALQRFSADGRGVVVYLRPAGSAAACALLDSAPEPSPVLTSVVDAILADLGVRGTATTEPAYTRLDTLAAARARRIAGEQRIAG
jgi:3,4-dihydroxy 2-butanone 4-phosphate synthase / GTP cyclohydrolase II